MPHSLRYPALRLVGECLERLSRHNTSLAAYAFLRDGTLIGLRGSESLPIAPDEWYVPLSRTRRGRVIRSTGSKPDHVLLTFGITRHFIVAVRTSIPVTFNTRSHLTSACQDLRKALIELLRTHSDGTVSGTPESGNSAWATVPPPRWWHH